MQPWSCSNECIYPAINKVWGNSESGVFALFETGDIIHYDGTNWISMYDADIYPELGMELNGIWGSSSSNVYVVGGTFIGVAFGGQRPVMPILIHYDGVNWLQGYIEGLPGETVKDIWGSSENDIFVVAAGYAYIKRSQILHYDGKSWTVMKRIPSTVLYDVWGSSGTDVFAVGHNDEGGVIWHYDGRKWIQMETGQNMEWFYPNAVWGSSGEDVYVGGMTGWGVTPFPIFHYDGRTWSAMANPPVNVEGIWGSSATDIYAAGWDYNWNGVILHYDGTDDGIAE